MKKSTHKFTKRPPASKKKAASKKTNRKPTSEANKKASDFDSNDTLTISGSTENSAISEATLETLFSGSTQKESTTELAESKSNSAASETADASEIVESTPITKSADKIPEHTSTRMLITSETMYKEPIVAIVEKRSSAVTSDTESDSAASENESISEVFENASIAEPTCNVMVARNNYADTTSKVFIINRILQRIKELSMPEFFNNFSIHERIKGFSISGYIKSVSISESIRNAPSSGLVKNTPIPESVENAPTEAIKEKAFESKFAEKPTILDQIKKLSPSDLIVKVAISEHVKRLLSSELIQRASFSESLQKIPVSGLIKKIPVPAFTKRIPGVGIFKKIPFSKINDRLAATAFDNQDAALFIRVGMGLLFIIGGCSKLSQLLDPSYAEGIVMSYVGTTGYINDVFLTFLFPSGSFLSPWGFLTALSSFELVSGVALVAGFLVRPLALVYAFLLWTFVFSLPVVTTPGVELTVQTYTSPAMFVQSRDIALSGMMFVLYQLGSGRRSLDSLFLVNANQSEQKNWDNLGLLLRLSVALPLLIGALFGSFGNIMTFASPGWILLVVSLLLIAGVKVRDAAAITMVIMAWYIMTKLTLDKSFIANLNGFKRELALFSGALVLFGCGGGNSYTPVDFARRIRAGLGRASTVPVEAI